MPPSERRAQAWLQPAAIATEAETPTTETGIGLDVVVPLPSSPAALSPQHFTPPEATIAQVS